MPPEDKKPPRPPPVHKDYGVSSKHTPPMGTLVIRETTSKQREDDTPPPEPGTITNEDLAVQIKDTRKEHETFAAATTQRLAVVEARVERVPEVERKVDQLLILTVEKQQKQEIASFDIYRAHVQVEAKEKEAAAQQQVVLVEDKAHAEKTKRERNLEIVKVAGKIVGYLVTGGFLLHLIEHC